MSMNICDLHGRHQAAECPRCASSVLHPVMVNERQLDLWTREAQRAAELGTLLPALNEARMNIERGKDPSS